MISPAMFLTRVGADYESVCRTHEDLETVEFLEKHKTAGGAEITFDENGNVLACDGRHHALAALLTGVKKIPVLVHRVKNAEEYSPMHPEELQALETAAGRKLNGNAALAYLKRQRVSQAVSNYFTEKEN